MKLASILPFLIGAAPLASASTEYALLEGTAVAPVANGYAGVELMASVAVPGSKHLLIGLSSEINLITTTSAKGTNGGGKDTSVASAGVEASIKFLQESAYTSAADVCGDTPPAGTNTASPSKVTLSSRMQTLSVTTDLQIKDELQTCEGCEITGYVEVELSLETTAAHHFNFIADIPETCSSSNPCKVVACYYTNKSTSVYGDGSAASYVAITNALLTVQEVLSFSKLN